jgi:hypothetical protein
MLELLVATALGVVLVGTVAFAFQQAQEIYSRTEARIEASLEARNALEKMKRDAVHMLATCDMEFFDPSGDGHYSGAGDALAGMNPVGGVPAGFDTANTEGYEFGPVVFKSSYDRSGKLQGTYRSDALYFLTEGWFANISPVLVEYRLEENGEKRSLVRRIAYVRPSGNTEVDARFGVASTLVLNCEPLFLVEDVLDFRVEFQTRPGTPFYDAEEAVTALGMTDKYSLETDKFAVEMGAREESRGAAVELGTGILTHDGEPFDFLHMGAWIYLFDPSPAGFTEGDYQISDIDRASDPVRLYLQGAVPPAENISLSYRAAWIPAAFRVSFTVLSPKKQEPMSFQSVLSTR